MHSVLSIPHWPFPIVYSLLSIPHWLFPIDCSLCGQACLQNGSCCRARSGSSTRRPASLSRRPARRLNASRGRQEHQYQIQRHEGTNRQGKIIALEAIGLILYPTY